jgi:hypothetical protein
MAGHGPSPRQGAGRSKISVMAGFIPAIHVFLVSMYEESKTWMPGTSPGMTKERE